MSKAIGTFFIAFICSFLLMVGGLIIWTKTIPLSDPSDADGLGFAVAFGIVAAFPSSIVIGIIVAVILTLFRKNTIDKN
ncbi:hypothetical protein MZM54_05465 [[Brevibacterium] frigoritolerans]|nr:hypothetical protein [Peribacillus frigoritolerans]